MDVVTWARASRNRKHCVKETEDEDQYIQLVIRAYLKGRHMISHSQLKNRYSCVSTHSMKRLNNARCPMPETAS